MAATLAKIDINTPENFNKVYLVRLVILDLVAEGYRRQCELMNTYTANLREPRQDVWKKLYCICGKPTGTMHECDGCKNWFHEHYIKGQKYFIERDTKKEVEKFFCPKCYKEKMSANAEPQNFPPHRDDCVPLIPIMKIFEVKDNKKHKCDIL